MRLGQFIAGRALACLVVLALILPINAKRKSEQRADLAGPSPSQLGWSVPLQGGQTCIASRCTNSLSPPASSYNLQYITLARGTITYSCANVTKGNPPIYMNQDTQIYDAAPIIPNFSSESDFHAFVPQFLNYDYTQLENSTLTCIGLITTGDGLSVIDLFNIDAYTVTVQEVLNPPSDSTYNLDWARSLSADANWEVYRAETVGGASPVKKCNDELEIQVRYAAEYWFYRK